MSILKNVEKLNITRSHVTFLLPFGFDQTKRREIINNLESNGYTLFQLEGDAQKEDDIYGYGIKVVGKELEPYFYPYIEHKLFPETDEDKGFHRYTALMNKSDTMQLRDELYDFTVRSVDIILAPFGIAFLALRVDIGKTMDLSDVLDFIQHFRALDSNLKESSGATIIICETEQTFSMYDYLFEYLCPFLKKNVQHEKKLKGHFGSLPYFEDERMFVSSFLIAQTETSISDEHLFRLGNVNGKTPEGHPFISSTNPNYIQRVLSNSSHDRWAPHLYMLVTEHGFSTISNRPTAELRDELSEHMGTHYYNMLLHYFYKMMLLRVSFEYSEIEWKKDESYVKSLIQLINVFSSSYYFKEISTRTEGKELSEMFRKIFHIDSLFNEASKTLQELYKSQENSQADRLNMLLFILTIFTVISGIYGMNLVISDWESPSGWKEYSSYTIFEWISLITAVSGIGLSAFLIFSTVGKMLMRNRRKNKLDMHD
ncbi:hypothetical protein MHZ92_01160 [Sporosarcina sp. ACRSL]|uniref:hypothetical protein n=1 Tax=Sporosarcina sp. ACRSL TaxID=2918215 RepID=UPI001EF6B90E|nr:hypothetical protein [Sporosarcina sp. ACRSL]MCG7342718.1 hypothetical protein [Sporosarcina sp. ACRSL]